MSVVEGFLLLDEAARLLDEGHEIELKAAGDSMLPFIVGDRDSVRLIRDSYGVGDVVLAALPDGSYALHRIVRMEDGKLVLKGDGNVRAKEYCSEEDVKGKMISFVKANGKTVECDEDFRRRAHRWNMIPGIIRRVILAIYKRIK